MNSSLPLVSVVLPVRNVHREWLTQSISSVLEQDYPNLELIIVNDETTENIDELVASFGVKKYIKNARNRKLPYSLNRGFEVADGTYHTWTSADNYMLPGMIKRLVKELEERKDLSIVCGRSRMIDENGVTIDSWEIDTGNANLTCTDLNDTDIEPRFTYYSSLGACFMYRKKVWERLRGYDEKRHGSEDFDFWLRASHQFKIGRIPWSEEPLYIYRVHSTSMSNTVPDCFTRARVQILKREVRLHPQNPDIRKALDHYEQLTPKRELKEIIWRSLEPMYSWSVQRTPTGLKKRVRTLLGR